VGGALSWLLWVWRVAIVVTPWWYGGADDSVRYGLAAVLLLSAAAVWGRFGSDSTVLAPALSLLAWPLLQILLGAARVPVLESLLVLAAGLSTLLVWSVAARDESEAERLTAAILVAALAQAAFGVVQAQVSPHTLYGRDDPGVRSPFGSFHNHNHFAGLMEMAILLTLGLAFGRTKRTRAIDPLTIALIGLGLALTAAHLASRSRGGLFALLVGGSALTVSWWASRARRRPSRRELVGTALATLAILAFGWLAVPADTRSHLATLFHGPTDGSGEYRVNISAASLRLWISHPFVGSGLGSYADEIARFRRSDGLLHPWHAESDVLEYIAEGGLIGLALLAWLAIACASGYWRRMMEGRDPWKKALATGALSAVVALAAHSLVDFNLRIPSNALAFCALAGLASAPRDEPPPRRAAVRRGVRILLACLGLAAGWRAWGAAELRSAQRTGTPQERLARLSATLSRHAYLAEAWRERAHLRWSLARGGPEMVTYRLQGAVEDIGQTLSVRPHCSAAWADLGWLRYMQRDNARAEQAFERAITLDPANVGVGLARAEFFARTDRLDEAGQELRRVRSYNLDWPETAAEAAARQMGIGSLK